jgi:hypothetical protein
MSAHHLDRYRYQTLYQSRGVVYSSYERDRIRRMGVASWVTIERRDRFDARDKSRAEADAIRYPWLFPDTTDSAAA